MKEELFTKVINEVMPPRLQDRIAVLTKRVLRLKGLTQDEYTKELLEERIRSLESTNQTNIRWHTEEMKRAIEGTNSSAAFYNALHRENNMLIEILHVLVQAPSKKES